MSGGTSLKNFLCFLVASNFPIYLDSRLFHISSITFQSYVSILGWSIVLRSVFVFNRTIYYSDFEKSSPPSHWLSAWESLQTKRSLCMFVCLHLSFCLSAFLYLSISLSFWLSDYFALSFCLIFSTPIFSIRWPYLCLFFCLSILYLSWCLSLYISFCLCFSLYNGILHSFFLNNLEAF